MVQPVLRRALRGHGELAGCSTTARDSPTTGKRSSARTWARGPGFVASERDELAEIGDWLLRHKHWEAAHGFDLDDVILTTIALQAALPVLELGIDYYREVSAIIVFPTTIMSRGTYAGPIRGTVTDGVVPVLGQAHDHRGPVIIAWDDA